MNSQKTSKFRHPTDIRLAKSPLIEAWLEIRWKLAESGFQGFQTDPYYPIALGVFYNNVKAEFGHQEGLPTSKAPEFMLPYIVQYQFRPAKDGWPLLQLGPGIATVNFTKPYSWQQFKEKALYLRQKLIDAYVDQELECQALILRYRNGSPFDYSTHDLLAFLRENLNLSVSIPKGVPGLISQKSSPTDSNIVLNYRLNEPQGTAQIHIGTAVSRETNDQSNTLQKELVVWEIQVASADDQAPNIRQTDNFGAWLDAAHAVIHEWFFSLIEGDLLKTYTKGE